MRKNILFKISSYLMVAAVFAVSGAWVATTFAGNANTGVLPESAGGTGATNYSAALALKAPLASPTFTGTPAAPTAVTTTNSTTLATTAFVKNAIDSYAPPEAYTASTYSNGNAKKFGRVVTVDLTTWNGMAAGTTMNTAVPTGYRPSAQQSFSITDGNSRTGKVIINTSGQVTYYGQTFTEANIYTFTYMV